MTGVEVGVMTEMAVTLAFSLGYCLRFHRRLAGLQAACSGNAASAIQGGCVGG